MLNVLSIVFVINSVATGERIMGKCKAGYYKTNIVVTHGPLVCFGGFGQPECSYLEECTKEHGMKKRKKRERKKS